jgi:hypothetical protein
MATPYVISSDLVSAYPAKSLEIAQYIDGFKADLALVQNAQTGTTYTFVAADFTKLVTASNGAASTYTIPPESSVTWPANTLLRVTNLGAGVVTFAGDVGVTVTNTAATLAQYQTATLVRTGSDAWTVIRQGANAPGMDLITPTSVAGSGVTLSGGAISFAAATSGSINGCFTTAYDVYRLVFRGATSAAGGISSRLRVAGSDASGANYNAQLVFGSSTTAGASASVSGTSWPSIGDGSIAETVCQFSMDLFMPALAQQSSFSSLQGYVDLAAVAAQVGRHTLSTAYDGITLFRASGTLTGTLRIYGLRN